MPVCEIDLRVGGLYRYVWRKEATGEEMVMGGAFHEVVRPEKLVATEKFDEAWYPGEAVDTTVLLYASKEARDTASRSGMEFGMQAGYTRLEEVLSSLPAGTPERRTRAKSDDADPRPLLGGTGDQTVELLADSGLQHAGRHRLAHLPLHLVGGGAVARQLRQLVGGVGRLASTTTWPGTAPDGRGSTT
jgi:uncharacterized protein YndB with AHSA1/START domain